MILISVIIIIVPSKADMLKLVSPQFVFTICFIPGVIYAYQYIEKWNLNLSVETVNVIVIGLFTFTIISYLTSWIYKCITNNTLKKNNTNNVLIANNNINVQIESWKIRALVIIELISLLLTVLFLVKTFGTNLSASIFAYRSTEQDNILPAPVKILRRFALSSGYIVSYLLLNGIVYKIKKNRFSELLCVIFAIINGFILGGRGDGIQLIFALIIQYFALKSFSSKQKRFPIKDFLIVLTILIVLWSTFIQMGNLLGREMSFLNFADYMGVYLSAELKNLDIFITTGQIGHPFIQSLTFNSIINSAGKMFSNPNWIQKLDMPFNYYGNYSLGNVGTIFYPFMYDAGIHGVICYALIMAVLCQIIYQRFLKANKFSAINLSFICYSFIFYIIAFSFFSDKFYEMIFNTAFIWTLVSWAVLKVFLLKIRL